MVGRWRQVLSATNAPVAAGTPATNPAAATFEFRHNGLLLTKGTFSPDILIPGLGDRFLTNRYSFMDEQTIRILFGRGRKEQQTVTMVASFSGNRLTLTETVAPLLSMTNFSHRARTNSLVQANTNTPVPAWTNGPARNWGGARGVLTLERIE